MTENPNQPLPDNGPENPDQPISDTSWSPYDEIPEYGARDATGTGPAGPGEPVGASTAADAGRTDAKAAWSDAGERLGGLGSKLRRHYEEQSGTSGTEAGAEVKDAAKKLGEAVQNAFEAFGNAAKDPEVKDDVRQVGRSVSDALAGTLAGLSGELRKTFGGRDDRDARDARDDENNPQASKPKEPGAPA